jgi:hypothetical protein
MSEAYTIVIEGGAENREKLRALYERGLPAGLHSDIARACAAVLETHLKRLDNERANPMGGKRSHFYSVAAGTVRGEVTTDGAEIVVNKVGLRQRWLGGTIYAKNGRFLTIPARAESYGIPARQFPRPLRFVKFKSGACALVIDDRAEAGESMDDAGNVTVKRRKRNKRMKTGGLVEYWLKESVYQSPDPSVLPTEQEFQDAANRGALDYFSNQ